MPCKMRGACAAVCPRARCGGRIFETEPVTPLESNSSPRRRHSGELRGRSGCRVSELSPGGVFGCRRRRRQLTSASVWTSLPRLSCTLTRVPARSETSTASTSRVKDSAAARGNTCVRGKTESIARLLSSSRPVGASNSDHHQHFHSVSVDCR